MAEKKAAVAKAAGAVAAGGGPEDPVGDAVAVKELVGGRKKPKAPTGADGSSRLLPRHSKMLMAEYLVCLVILIFGTVIAPTGKKDGIPKLMTRATALSILFFILALASGGGAKAEKVTAAFGGLVTVAYVVLSPDLLNVVKWIATFFSATSVEGQAQAEASVIEINALEAEQGSGVQGAAE